MPFRRTPHLSRNVLLAVMTAEFAVGLGCSTVNRRTQEAALIPLKNKKFPEELHEGMPGLQEKEGNGSAMEMKRQQNREDCCLFQNE